jgi:hypothetical protein
MNTFDSITKNSQGSQAHPLDGVTVPAASAKALTCPRCSGVSVLRDNMQPELMRCRGCSHRFSPAKPATIEAAKPADVEPSSQATMTGAEALALAKDAGVMSGRRSFTFDGRRLGKSAQAVEALDDDPALLAEIVAAARASKESSEG